MSHDGTCCGCVLVDDYGTSQVIGDGSKEDPYSVSQLDPSFNRPVVRVNSSGTGVQSIPNNTPTPINYTTVNFDSHGMWNVANPSRLTIQIQGLYLFGFNTQWSSGVGAAREIFFRLNGTTELDRQSQNNDDAVILDQDYDMTYQWFFSVGDYIEAVAFQNSGAPVGLGLFRNYIWALYLGKKV